MENREAIEIIKGLIRTAELGYNSNPLSKEGEHTATEALTLAISALEKQEQDRWIPVTERLPEYGKEVLTQLSDNDIVVNWVIDEEDGEWFEYGVVAWRPLPELYEGRRDGNK